MPSSTYPLGWYWLPGCHVLKYTIALISWHKARRHTFHIGDRNSIVDLLSCCSTSVPWRLLNVESSPCASQIVQVSLFPTPTSQAKRRVVLLVWSSSQRCSAGTCLACSKPHQSRRLRGILIGPYARTSIRDVTEERSDNYQANLRIRDITASIFRADKDDEDIEKLSKTNFLTLPWKNRMLELTPDVDIKQNSTDGPRYLEWERR